MDQEKKKKTGTKKRTVILVICIILAVLLVLVAAAWFVLDRMVFSRVGRIEDDYTLSEDEIAEIIGPGTDEITVPSIPVDIIKPDEDVINILLVGQDRREGQPRLHSDATILCTINKNTKTLTMTSFMRDMWVKIPGYGEQRINTTYMINGFPLLNKTLEYNFGVSADYNVEVDFNGFITVVDRIGGLDLELTEAEAKYLNKNGLWDVEPDLDWSLVEGVNHMDGKQALAYSRIRKIGDDFQRTQRQRIVLSKMIEKAKQLSTAELYALVYDLIPMLSTDMSDAQILGLAVDLAPMLSELEIVSQRIPMDGQYSFANINGNEVITLSESNLRKARQLLTKTMKSE